MKFSSAIQRFGMASASVALTLMAGTAVAKEVTIAIVAANMEYPFNAAEVRGFQAEAKELGVKSVVLDPKGSVEKQGNAVDDLITRKVDGIGSILLDSVVAKTWIDRANESNIPFVSVGVQVGDPEKVPLKDVYPKLTALVTRDDVESGVIAGQMAAKFLPKDRVAQIGIVEGSAGVAAVKQRSQGFEEGLKRAGVKYKIVASQPTDWTEVKGEAVCQNILTAHPDVDLFFAQYSTTTWVSGAVVRFAIWALTQKSLRLTAVQGAALMPSKLVRCQAPSAPSQKRWVGFQPRRFTTRLQTRARQKLS